MSGARPTWALCLGGADCVWEDVLAWERLYGQPWDGLVIAANDVGAHWPRELHHWVSLHPEKFERWRALRDAHGFAPLTDTYWASEARGRRFLLDPVTTRRLVPWPGGSSGMFAVQVARELGCTRIVLCGIPLTATPHFSETHERFHAQWVAANGHWRAWTRYVDRMRGHVRSMSGRTAELLGTPTRTWLVGEDTDTGGRQ